MVECIVATVHRVLSRGGRAGFVHGHIADTRRYAGSGSLIDTFAPTVKAVLWEKLLFIERYGPAALSNRDYKFVHRRFCRVFYRRLALVGGDRSVRAWPRATIGACANADAADALGFRRRGGGVARVPLRQAREPSARARPSGQADAVTSID